MGDHRVLKEPSVIRNWLNLMTGLIIIGVFIWVLAPMMDHVPMVRPLVDFIETRDIDASALYYTEIEEFSTASFFMDNSRNYRPEAP